MIAKSYPNPSQEFYLVYDIQDVIEKEFKSMKWDITKIEAYRSSRGSALPFSVSLTTLMKAILK
jgi:hypothetical protein